ncbi:hypothetical protein [Nostoc sp.]|uniref:hypothetical protein n=1 Tax=Nostoc sp. TaxID=1180 RepID=UPI002FEF198D
MPVVYDAFTKCAEGIAQPQSFIFLVWNTNCRAKRAIAPPQNLIILPLNTKLSLWNKNCQAKKA